MRTTQKIKTILFFAFILSVKFQAISQTIVGYSFDKYKVEKVFEGKKAVVDYKSSKTAKSFRTQIKEQYKTSKVDFAGHYTTIGWGAGMGLTLGAIVDVETGKVYDLPLTEENSYRGCGSTDDIDNSDNILHKKNSTLFITFVCSEKVNETTKATSYVKVYSVFNWDETKKKFILLKKKTVETK
jgi:hypothetical protein